jgi:hypothetical protein
MYTAPIQAQVATMRAANFKRNLHDTDNLRQSDSVSAMFRRRCPAFSYGKTARFDYAGIPHGQSATLPWLWKALLPQSGAGKRSFATGVHVA